MRRSQSGSLQTRSLEQPERGMVVIRGQSPSEIVATVEDADAGHSSERALFGEPGMPPPQQGWQRSRVLALFEQRQQAQEKARQGDLPRF